MLNYVFLDPKGILSGLLSTDTSVQLRNIGERVLNGTMNILSLMLVILIAYHIASKKTPYASHSRYGCAGGVLCINAH